MPRIKKFNSQSKFKGNKYVNNRLRPTVETSTPISNCKSAKMQTLSGNKSASSKKLLHSNLPSVSDNSNGDFNLIFSLELLSNIIKGFTKCKYCDGTNCVTLRIDENYKNGLAHKIIIECTLCKRYETGMNFNIISHIHEVKIRFAYALRSIGRGSYSGKMFTSVMNLAVPNTRFQKYYDKLLIGAAEVCDASLQNAAIDENEGSKNITAAFDGSWQKRGHTSLNGVVTATSFDTGKVLDFECLSKFCAGCVSKYNVQNSVKAEQHKKTCSSNYSGSSGGMEVEGAKVICARSESKLGVRYTQYLGDGDSKGFAAVLQNKPYGDDVQITKLECVGHVQKRLGTRLRKIKLEKKGLKFSDGKGIGGKGRLTNAEIDQLQRYYGLAIRRNLTSVKDMKQAIWASFLHKISTDSDPQHFLCPKGEDSWCGYNKSQANKTQYSHKNNIPKEIMELIKPVYKDLSKTELLKRCLHGKTQNPNESFNSCIWQRVPKTVFVGHKTLQLGVTDAVICFNEGCIGKANVLERLRINPGKFMVNGLKIIDRDRIFRAEKESEEQYKKKRVRKRLLKRKQEDIEVEYCPGGF